MYFIHIGSVSLLFLSLPVRFFFFFYFLYLIQSACKKYIFPFIFRLFDIFFAASRFFLALGCFFPACVYVCSFLNFWLLHLDIMFTSNVSILFAQSERVKKRKEKEAAAAVQKNEMEKKKR